MVLRIYNVKMNYLLPEKDAVLKEFEIHLVIIIIIIIITIVAIIITTTAIKSIDCLALLKIFY